MGPVLRGPVRLAAAVATIVLAVAIVAVWRTSFAPGPVAKDASSRGSTVTGSSVAKCQPLIDAALPPLVDDPCAVGTFTSGSSAQAQAQAAQLLLADPAVTGFVADGRFAIAASVIDLAADKFTSSGDRYVEVVITRYADGQTWIARVDTSDRSVLSLEPFQAEPGRRGVAGLNPVESELAFAIAERDPAVASELARLKAERYRADVVQLGYGPAVCASQRCAMATWSKGPLVAVNLSSLQVVQIYPRSDE